MQEDGSLNNVAGAAKRLRLVKNMEGQKDASGKEIDHATAVEATANRGMLLATNFERLNQIFWKMGSSLKFGGSGQHVSGEEEKKMLARGVMTMMAEEKKDDGQSKYSQEEIATMGELIRASKSTNLINKGRDGMADARQIISHERMHDVVEGQD